MNQTIGVQHPLLAILLLLLATQKPHHPVPVAQNDLLRPGGSYPPLQSACQCDALSSASSTDSAGLHKLHGRHAIANPHGCCLFHRHAALLLLLLLVSCRWRTTPISTSRSTSHMDPAPTNTTHLPPPPGPFLLSSRHIQQPQPQELL